MLAGPIVAPGVKGNSALTCAAHNWQVQTTIASDGTLTTTCTQPGFGDLSAGSIVPSASGTYDVGANTSTGFWRSLYLNADTNGFGVRIVPATGRGSSNTYTLPSLGDSTFAFIDQAQTYSGTPTFNAAVTFTSSAPVGMSANLSLHNNLIFDTTGAFHWANSTLDTKPFDYYSTANQRMFGLDATAMYAMFIKGGNEGFNYAHGNQSNPTVFIHSANQNTTQWLGLTHNATDAVIFTGTGGLDLTGLNSQLTKWSNFSLNDSTKVFSPVVNGASDLGSTAIGFGHLYLHRISASTALGNAILGVDDLGNTLNARLGIGFGYTNGSNNPGEVGCKTVSTAGNTDCDLYMAVRNGTTNVAPSDQFYVVHDGTVAALTGPIYVGGTAAPRIGLGWNTTLTTPSGQLLVDSTSRNLSLIDIANIGFNYAPSNSSNPTFYLYSVNQNTAQWGSLSHNGTNFVINTGTGGIVIPTVPFYAGTDSSSYVNLYTAGTSGAAVQLSKTSQLRWMDSSLNASTGNPVVAADGCVTTLTKGSAVAVVLQNIAATSMVGGSIAYTVQSRDGTNQQARTGRVMYSVTATGSNVVSCSVYNYAATTNPAETQDGSVFTGSAGTLTYTWGTDTSTANTCKLTLNATTSLTPTVFQITYFPVKTGGSDSMVCQ